MDDKQTRTLKRLVKKLSALRQTLTKSERELLDTLVLGASAEVEAHAMAAGRAAAGRAAAGRAAAGRAAAGRAVEAVQTAEVEGHAMAAGRAAAGRAAAGRAVAGRQVVFDAASASYQVVD